MQQPASTQPSPPFSDFAGLLATLASPPPDTTEDAPLWNDGDLGEDVATLSYEQALRARARYRSAYRSDGSPISTGGLDADADVKAAIEGFAADAAPALQSATAPDRDLRSASVTIRLSKGECARVHQRAVEAGLTVSAYLRSCALEAETLRAQVKQALAELKAGSEAPTEQERKEASQPGSKAAPPLRDAGRERGSKATGWRKFFNWVALFARTRR
jgi:hypothetical protein